MPRFLLTRSAEGNRDWAERLAEHGFESVSLPCLDHELVDEPAVRARLAGLWSGPDAAPWWTLTSPRGVRSAAALLPSPRPDGPKIAAVGPTTAEACRQHFGRCDLVAEVPTGRGLAESLLERLGPDSAVQRVAIAAADRGRRDLETVLEPHGIAVDRVAVYRTMPARPVSQTEAADLDILGLDGILIASPSAGLGLAALATWTPDFDVPAVAIGPTTAAALRDHPRTRSFQVRIASEPSLEGMLAAWQGPGGTQTSTQPAPTSR